MGGDRSRWAIWIGETDEIERRGHLLFRRVVISDRPQSISNSISNSSTSMFCHPAKVFTRGRMCSASSTGR